MLQHLCVFCGSAPGKNPVYAETARLLGQRMAAENIGLVYGGGRVGLMGILADAVLEHGGRVLGVIPQFLVDREAAHPGLQELIVVDTMHQRKQIMCDRSDAAIAIAGGTGTLDELFELLTWGSLGLHRKSVGLINTNGFYDPLLAHVQQMVQEGFVSEEKARDLIVENSVEEMLLRLRKP